MSFKETALGALPSSWQVATMEEALSDIIDYRGKTPKKSEIGIPTLSAKSVKNGYIDYSSAYFISPEEHKRFMVRGIPKKGDILMTTEAPIGYVAKLDNDSVGIAQRLLTLRGKANYLENNYLMYYLMSAIGQHQLLSRASGTTVTGIRQSEFRKVLVSIPPIQEQKVIGKILSDLDEKIEVNNQINDNLEKMAQTIFKQWFVDFEFPNEDGKPYKSSGGEMVESELGMVPKGWEVKTIGDLSNVVSKGTTPRKSDLDNADDENSIKFIKVKDISDDGIIDLTNIEYIPKSVHSNQLKRSVLSYKDILLSIAGTIGRVSYVDEEVKNSNTNQAVAFIRLIDINRYFLLVFYKFKSNDFQNSIQSKVVQGVQANISLTVIKNEKIIVPSDGIIGKYNNIVDSIFNKKDTINRENNKLKSIRDTLLPKLMSGEIRVPLD